MTQPARGALSRGGRAYVAVVGAIGTAVFAYCAWTLSDRGVASTSQFLLFVGLTFASGRLTARDVMNTTRIIATRAAIERLQEVLG